MGCTKDTTIEDVKPKMLLVIAVKVDCSVKIRKTLDKKISFCLLISRGQTNSLGSAIEFTSWTNLNGVVFEINEIVNVRKSIFSG